jgi:hypothetical protein
MDIQTMVATFLEAAEVPRKAIEKAFEYVYPMKMSDEDPEITQIRGSVVF